MNTADLILHNGKITTVNPKQPEAQAVAIREGRFLVAGSDKDVIRYTVTLKLKDKKGKQTEREVVYAVALKSPVVVSRDPYY